MKKCDVNSDMAICQLLCIMQYFFLSHYSKNKTKNNQKQNLLKKQKKSILMNIYFSMLVYKACHICCDRHYIWFLKKIHGHFLKEIFGFWNQCLMSQCIFIHQQDSKWHAAGVWLFYHPVTSSEAISCWSIGLWNCIFFTRF